ncbi:hypothetical protein [Desulfobacca acetoxidans]|nr:hypothetical protein [Desulfobacterales bacterium]
MHELSKLPTVGADGGLQGQGIFTALDMELSIRPQPPAALAWRQLPEGHGVGPNQKMNLG